MTGQMAQKTAGAAGGRPTEGENLAQRLEARLQDLEAEQGSTVPLAEVGSMVADLLLTLDGDITSADIELQNELRDLADYIRRAHQELEALEVGDLRQRQIPEAADQLDAVVQATEEATGVFLDAAEEVQAIARELTGPHSDRLNLIGNRIFEASNFQDITGQRITKVVTTLRHIEAKILTLTETFGLQGDSAEQRRPGDGKASAAGQDDEEKALLNGPQLPSKGNSQDDIDAFFD
ncbi:MAG: protein phosphatase CheZ [Sneathiellaceae bacterium]|uniref:protein phosphatase CheZ n=1 Tax=Marinovum algicola TaxID=42444 RepID=UPI0032EDAD8E